VDWREIYEAGKLTDGDNLCTGCWENFGSVDAFDAHRVGRHEYTLWEGLHMEPPREDGRRCLSVEEMQEHGFAVGVRGRWTISPFAGATYRVKRKQRKRLAQKAARASRKRNRV
jgi:hypothetical protein